MSQGFILKSPYDVSLPPFTFFPLEPNDIPDDYPPPPPTLERQTNHDKVGLDDDGYLGDEEDASEDGSEESEDDEIKTKYPKLRRTDSMFVDGLKRTDTALDGLTPPYSKLRRTDSMFVDGFNPTGIEDSW
jgi:hypothetical protein